MKIMKCKDCGATDNLTRHSIIGYHVPPFIILCEECHRKRHNIKLKTKYPGKYAKGTKRVHKGK